MLRRGLSALALTAWATLAAANEAPLLPEALMHAPTVCIACTEYARHLQEAGFRVSTQPTDDMAAIKRRLKVPSDLEAVPTTQVGPYVIEGHVPAEDIVTLLREKPLARGLAVPGLPQGAPGREAAPPTCETGCTVLDVESSIRPDRREAYNTLLVKPDGSTRVWARH